ncbi:MAG: hypothetical protein L6428_09715 [Candidatus Aminicenantes bacterium]|nr:hypothetical protein [Candidatus Aminicenantes bacterium]
MSKIGSNRRKVIGRPFTKGGPGTGRKPGQKNKFTTLKASFLEVFEQLDSTAGFLAWAKASPRNRAQFYSWLARMLPSDVNVSASVDTQAAIDDQLRRMAENMMLPDPTPEEMAELCKTCKANGGPSRIDTSGPLDGVPLSYENGRKLTKMIDEETAQKIIARAEKKEL